MGLIFISHSSRDNAEAVAMCDWLATQGWDDVFLDLDASSGLAPGQRWREELRKAGERCSAVVVLVSHNWAASKWCLTEFLFAVQLGKEIFPVLIGSCPLSDLPTELTATYQFADISTPQQSIEGHERLRIGLQRAGLHPNAFPWPPHDEPNRSIFRGLRTLEERDAAIFFGRDLSITKALDAIRRLRDGAPERMLVILGASGAGKSSFLRAGLLARLKRDTERFLVLPTMRPGRAALTGATGLRQSLGLDTPLDGPTIAAYLAALRAPIVAHVRSHSPRPANALVPPTVILPIDQAEELFVAGDEEAAAALAAIGHMLRVDRNLLLLLTIRSDSFGLLQGAAVLSEIPRLPFDLPRLASIALKDIIEGPTRLPGVRIAIDEDLTDQLIQDFDGADALPLLAFTLERLVADHGGDARLEKREYVEEMKGVGGAIRQAVEVAFAKAAEIPGLPRGRAELDALAQRAFVPGLVRIDDVAAPPKRRIALRRRLPPEALPLLDCLVDQRLLVADTAGAEATVEVSHEAVLRHWRELATWVADRRDDLALSERVKAAAQDWRVAAEPTKEEMLVHRGERLRTAEQLLVWEDLRTDMGEDSLAYLAACRGAEKRGEASAAAQVRRQRQFRQWIAGLVAAAALVTAVGAVLVVAGQRNLGRAQSLTLARAANLFADEGDYIRAMRLGIVAARDNWLTPASPQAKAALSSNAQALKLLMEFGGHEGPVHGAVLSEDEARIVTWSSDGTARLWNVSTGRQITPALKHDGPVSGAVFSKDNARILTWSEDGTAHHWNAATGTPIGQALTHDGPVFGATFSRDGTRILTWSIDKTARLWNASTGAQIGPSLTHDFQVMGAAFSEQESQVLTWSYDNTLRRWEAATGKEIGPVLNHGGPIASAVFWKDKTRILTVGVDARLWDAVTRTQIGPALTHDRAISGAIVSKDEARILTWSDDQTARLWNADAGTQIGPAFRHDAPVTGVAFSKDEDRILTWSEDKTARLWNVANGRQIGRALTHAGPVAGAVFSEDEATILTWSDDQTARVWNAVTGSQIGPALKHDGPVLGAAFLKDQRRILTWSTDQTARLWTAATGAQIRPALRHDNVVRGAVFSKDETRILTWSGDGTARLWNAANGAPIGAPFIHDFPVSGAVFSKDETRILTWGVDRTARLWNAATTTQIGPALTHNGTVWGAAFSRDEARILTWSVDGTARLWEAATGTQIGPPFRHGGISGAHFFNNDTRILTWGGSTAAVWDPATGARTGVEFGGGSGAVFSKDEARVLTWNLGKIAWLTNPATGAQIGEALRHDGSVRGAIFSNDEAQILTWSEDSTARLWNSVTGAPIGHPLTHDGSVSGAAFSRDGARILTWSADKTARLWNAATGAQIGPSLTHDMQVTGAAFSKEESRVLTWSLDSTARLWDAATGTQIGPALSHDGPIVGAVFSKDETRILTASNDETARLWDVRWAMRDTAAADFVPDICQEKLLTGSSQSRTTSSAVPALVGVRRIDARDTTAAPILRGREGENVCESPPTTWQVLRSLLDGRK